MNGAVEDKSFELLLSNITDWLIDNPKPNWLKALTDAKMYVEQQIYIY